MDKKRKYLRPDIKVVQFAVELGMGASSEREIRQPEGQLQSLNEEQDVSSYF